MRQHQSKVLGLLMLITVTGSVLLALSAHSNQSSSVGTGNPAPVQRQPSLYTSAPTGSVPIGIPAIQPRTAVVGSSMPSFTADDARQWAQSHGIPHASVVGKLTVSDVIFAPSWKVSATLGGEDMGVPDSSLLCLVELHGSVTFTNPRVGPVTYPVAYEVFDAETGNLIVFGGHP